jgi:hypothetical protein
MKPTRCYFSLSEITDPANHRDHNEWHSLDHRPENLLIPGIAWGDRWVRSPDCRALSHGSAAAYDAAHYAIMYWFREPMAHTLDDFFVLSERSFAWGRSPQVGWTKRPMRGFFVPIRGYVAPRVRVSADALPYRPVTAILVTLSRIDHANPDARRALAWYDETRLPDLIQTPGVAGAWSFADDTLFQPPWQEGGPAWSFADRASRAGMNAPNHMRILYLDGEPAQVLDAIAEADRARSAAGRVMDTSAVEDVMFVSPLRAIVPWEWDWFAAGSMPQT